jgi:hypothetical protein
LSVATIRAAVERILRAGGIPALTGEAAGLATAIFEINATPVQSKQASVYGVNITGLVIQQVFLRNGSEMTTPAITWGKSHTAVVSAKSLKAQVLGHVESIANEFANDFLSVNPP